MSNTATHLSRFWELQFSPSHNSSDFVTSALRENQAYAVVIMSFRLLLDSLLPLFALVFFNYSLLNTLKFVIYFILCKLTESDFRKRSHLLSQTMKRDHSLTVVLIFIVFIFILCHLLQCLLNAYELYIALQGRLLWLL